MDYRATLDPQYPEFSVQQLDEVCDLHPETLLGLRRVIALYPRLTYLTLDEQAVDRPEGLGDPFTFDTEHDELVLFSRDEAACVDGLVELAMYLSGFATLLGEAEDWVVEFAIGAWRSVRNNLKRDFDLPLSEHVVGMVGEPPAPDANADTPAEAHPFHTLVSSFGTSSFYTMILLAGHQEIAVYFPPQTNPKVLAAYIYARRAMHEISRGIGLGDHEEFNRRLLDSIHRLTALFWPSGTRAAARAARPETVDLRHLGGLDLDEDLAPELGSDDPFAAYIEDLLLDDEDDEPEG